MNTRRTLRQQLPWILLGLLVVAIAAGVARALIKRSDQQNEAAQAAQTIPFTYTVSTRTAEITVEDCLIGDVFLIAGDQTVTTSLEEAGSWRGIPDPLIRVIDVANENSQWNRPTSLTIGNFGALSYHFAIIHVRLLHCFTCLFV
jgi:hypothetical protein